MWQEQLISIVEGNNLDPDHIADLLVTYEAETGDASLRDCGVEVLMFMGALRPLSGSKYRSGSGYRYRPGSRSWSRSWSGSRSGSGPWSRSGSRSKSWSVFGSLSGSRSWYKSRSRSGSRSASGSISWSVFM
jgi:hypothetical protein